MCSLPMRYLFAILALAMAAVALGIFVGRPTDRSSARVRESQATPIPRIEIKAVAITPAPSETSEPETKPAAPELSPAPPLALNRGKLPWEEKIESVLRDDGLNNTAKARLLLAMLPVLPEDGFGTAAEECVKRLPDADYNAVALPLIANPQTHGAVANVLFADLMERPDSITLPALLRIAQIPNHPYAKSAQDNLRLLLDEDFGNDWAKWAVAVRTALTRNGE